LLIAALGLSLGTAACDDASKSDDAKADAKADDKKADDGADAKAADAKADDAKAADAKADDAKADDTKADDAKADDSGGADGAAEEGGDAPPPVVEAGAKGPAYFAVRDRGVVRLDGGEFKVIDGAPDILLRDMHVAEDGKLYLLGSKGIMRIEGDKATMVAETSFKTTGSVDAFAVTKDGTIWAVGYKGISKWDGKAWTTEEKKVLGGDVTLIKGVAVDGKAQVWVASSNKLHLLEGEAWTEVDVAKAFPRKPFFDMVRRAPDGTAYGLASSALIKISSKDEIEAVDLELKGFSSLGLLAFADNGIMALRSKIDAVLVRQPDGSSTEYAAGKAFQADSIRAVGVDSTGRAWIGTDIGVAIVGPGEAKVEWNSGSVLELAGQVEQIVPIGAGPDLPEVGPVKTAGLKGKILSDGKGVGDTEVELCPSPDMLFKTSPCGDSSVKFAGKTTAEGEFAFDAVPIGAYGIAVKVGGKWQLTMSSNFGTKMKEGESYDIGSINVKAK
jgi:hypothetical protein